MARSETKDEQGQNSSKVDDSDKKDEPKNRSDGKRGEDGSQSDGSRRPRKRLPGLQVFERAKEQLAVITGRSPDSVSAFAPSEDGWELTIEMVDIEKIPPTTSVMASYGVEVDDEGNILEYQLVDRYTRGQSREES
jgi:hypothetical protein